MDYFYGVNAATRATSHCETSISPSGLNSREPALHSPAADSHQFAALVSAGHVVQHRSVVDESVKFSAKRKEGAKNRVKV